MNDITVTIEEGQRQMILLAIARLAIERPGWNECALGPIAELLKGRELYEHFKKLKRAEWLSPIRSS